MYPLASLPGLLESSHLQILELPGAGRGVVAGSIRVLYSTCLDGIHPEETQVLICSRKTSVGDLAAKLRSDDKVRVMRTSASGAIRRVLRDVELLVDVHNSFRIEPIPLDEVDVPIRMLIPVNIRLQRHENPISFVLVLRVEEEFRRTKDRVLERARRVADLESAAAFRWELKTPKTLLPTRLRDGDTLSELYRAGSGETLEVSSVQIRPTP
jgi:hypothetical protein